MYKMYFSQNSCLYLMAHLVEQSASRVCSFIYFVSATQTESIYIRAGYHTSRYDTITNTNFIHDAAHICVTEEIQNFLTASISQELQNTVNQFHINDSQVKQHVLCTVALLNTHLDLNLNIIKY